MYTWVEFAPRYMVPRRGHAGHAVAINASIFPDHPPPSAAQIVGVNCHAAMHFIFERVEPTASGQFKFESFIIASLRSAMKRIRRLTRKKRKNSRTSRKPASSPNISSLIADMPMRVFGACHLDKELWVACVVGEVPIVPWQTRVDLMYLWWVRALVTTCAQRAPRFI